MKKNKKLLIIISAIVVAVIVVIGVFKNFQRGNDDTVIRIGAILPLTGVSSDLAAPMMCAMKIAEDEANRTRTLEQKKIKILFEDGKSTSAATISAYQKLIRDNITACIVFGDVQCYNLAATVNAHPCPTIALSAAAENIPSLSPHYFRAWTTTRDSCMRLAEFAHSDLGSSKFAVLAINNNFGDEAEKTVRAFAQKNGVDILSETFEIGAQDVRGQISKILTAHPDSVFVFGFGPGYITVFNQLKEARYSGAILTDEVVTIPGYAEKISDGAKGVYYCSTAFDPDDKESSYYLQFVRSFETRFTGQPNAHSAFAYFSVDVLCRAIDLSAKDGVDIEDSLIAMGEVSSVIGRAKFDQSGELITKIYIRRK